MRSINVTVLSMQGWYSMLPWSSFEPRCPLSAWRRSCCLHFEPLPVRKKFTREIASLEDTEYKMFTIRTLCLSIKLWGWQGIDNRLTGTRRTTGFRAGAPPQFPNVQAEDLEKVFTCVMNAGHADYYCSFNAALLDQSERRCSSTSWQRCICGPYPGSVGALDAVQ